MCAGADENGGIVMGQGPLGQHRKLQARALPTAEDVLVHLLLTLDVEQLYRYTPAVTAVSLTINDGLLSQGCTAPSSAGGATPATAFLLSENLRLRLRISLRPEGGSRSALHGQGKEGRKYTDEATNN